MSTRIALPEELRGRAFTVRTGHDHGLGRGRMQGTDVAAPFHGTRAPADAGPFSAAIAALASIMRMDSAFSHATAARLWGVPLPRTIQDDPMVHVSTRLPATRTRHRGVRGHTTTAAEPFVLRHGVRVTDPIATWLALAPVLGDDDLVAAGDHLVLTPRFPARDNPRPYVALGAFAEGVARYRGRSARRVRRLAALVRDGSESRRETHLRLALIRDGLPEPALNVEIHDAGGRFIGRADLLYPEWRVIVEYDGDHHRTDRAQFDHDVIRREDLIAAGFRYLSVRAPSAALAPERVRAALRAAGWKPNDESRMQVQRGAKVHS